jgi:hypothetical protein
MRIAACVAVLSGLLASPAGYSHPAPSSLLRLEFRPGVVAAEYWLPVSELAHARAADRAGTDFAAYLLRHVAAETSAGEPWQVTVQGVREATYLEHAYLVAELWLVPPAGAPLRPLVLTEDAVTHEVRNHVVYVVEKHGADSQLLGALQYPARRLEILAPALASGPSSAQDARGQHDNGAQQLEHPLEGDAQQSERQ